jgi:vacuolar-type H+-ATPase subunit H
VLTRIKEAEAEVDRLLERARDAREAAVAKARQDALRHIRNAEDKARAAYQEAVAAAQAEAKRAADRLTANAAGEVAKIDSTFQARLEDAKKRILSMFERSLDAQS